MDINEVTIIINTYPSTKRTEQLSRLLDSIFNQTYEKFNILLVENFDNKRSISQIARKYNGKKQKIKIINDPIKKLSVLFDIGWRKAKTELIAYVADDVELDKNWLTFVVKELAKGKKTAVVTGPLISQCFPTGEMHRLYLLSQKNFLTKILAWPYLYFTMEEDILKPGNLFESGAYSLGQALPESVKFKRQKVDLATTSSMGIKREVLQKINGFDYRFNFNHADGDLFIRIRKLGYAIIFNPKMIAYHHMRLGPSRHAYFIGLDTGAYYRKHVRPKTMYGIIGAVLNILVLNFYWIYAAIKNKDYKQLGGISGFIKGLFISY